jgi:AcrR family transcriptional regulator
MGRVQATQRHSRKRPAVRSGRPPRKRTGEVDERILDAARRVFLERGLAGASIDEIAARAHAGKPSIYARFPSKEALYAAVIMRNVADAEERLGSNVPAGATIEERLANIAATTLHWALTGNTIDLMRASISEARRFPDLASNVSGMARQRGAEAVGRLLNEAIHSDALEKLPAFAPEQVAATARFFMDVVVFPILIRGLFGENLDSLQAEIGPHVAARVALFLAACRHRGID